jgi:SHS family lactate transporter-like MFS transporter
MVGAISGGLVFGYLSDRIGRRKSMIIALILAMLVIPLWSLSPLLGLLLVGGFIMQFMVQGAWGIIPAHLTELSPDSVRGFLPGFAYQCGVLLAGSVAYIQAIFAARTSYPTTMALTTLTVLIGAVIVTALGREKRGIHFGVDVGE